MRTRSLVMCTVMAMTLAACGGDATDETTATTDGTTTTAAADTTTTTTSAPSSSEEGSGADTANLPGVCLEATQAMGAAMSSYATGMAGAMTGNLDSESLELAAGQMEAMAEAAPDEIQDDMRVIASELAKFYEALADVDYEAGAVPTPAQSEALAALAEVIDQEAFDEAATGVNAWFEDNC